MSVQPNQIVYVLPTAGSSQPVTAYPQATGTFPVVQRPKVNKLALYGCIATAVTGVSLFWGGWFNQVSLVHRSLSGSSAAYNRGQMGQLSMPRSSAVDHYIPTSERPYSSSPYSSTPYSSNPYPSSYSSYPSSSGTNSGFTYRRLLDVSESDMLRRSVLSIGSMGSLTDLSLGFIISGILLTLLGLTGLVHLASKSGDRKMTRRLIGVEISLFFLQIAMLIGVKWCINSWGLEADSWISACVGMLVMSTVSFISAICLIVYMCTIKYVESGVQVLAKIFIGISIWAGHCAIITGWVECLLSGSYDWAPRLLLISYCVGVLAGLILAICHGIEVSTKSKNAETEVKAVTVY